ncbi:SAM-dependent methyltransferase [Cryptosporangium aurantiacum]|uniref:Methyltransferase domain-containing protein n=1 Tax=Cryptosporangium aurantiacum TaxID=134849 RepID=A0A1M7MC63_9ACTN|nr:class I SAM-dependent methyltransferase [Cryptosporangium aurantiacum]SHM88401.1 Methyltransferase domain-containing protein [Cryptosporangium aurantiacum]
MPDTTAPPRLRSLEFHSPLSPERAQRLVDRLVDRLAPAEPSTVLDVGSGWGALLLRLLDAAPGATGVGIDLNADDLARGREIAGARGLSGRVEFAEESGIGTTRGPADVVLCVGSGHALTAAPGDFAGALRELRRLVAPGGRVLYGEGFWQRTPTDDELARMWPDAAAHDHFDLAGLVDLAVAAGFRPLWIETATEDEWEQFESGYQADLEEWLAANPAHPEAADLRERADRHRASWLAGYRNILNMAYLTLVPVAEN